MRIRNALITTALAITLAVPSVTASLADNRVDCPKQGACPTPHKPQAAQKAKADHKQDHRNQDKKHHQAANWHHKGGKMPHTAMGPAVDYRKHGLRKPPQGHRWVRIDNDYVLVAVSTGIIAGIIAATN